MTGSLGGYAGGDQARLLQLTRLDWRSRAVAELARRHGRLVEVFDDALLGQIAEGRVDVGRVAAGMAAPASLAVPELDAPPAVVEVMREAIARIALEQLGIDTLERRHSGSLDFYDLAV